MVQEDQLAPQVCIFASLDHLGNVDPIPEDLHVLHYPSLVVVLRQSDSQLGEHAPCEHAQGPRPASSSECEMSFLEVTLALVLLDEIIKLFGMKR